ncbi:MAG: hypothetical protein WDO16_10250 [Bacteroidota bacterium]
MMSSSDAHSPHKLGREANLFHTTFAYDSLFKAVQSKNGFLGTYEFYPEEGKYSYDGHRKCGVCFSPGETKKHKGLCPVCKKPLTIGVMNRIDSLADQSQQTDTSTNFHYIVPLAEILSEIHGVSPESKRVIQQYIEVINRFGNEFTLLQQVSIEDIRSFNTVLAEAIHNMRTGKVYRKAGYDGVYGTISVLEKKNNEVQLQMF